MIKKTITITLLSLVAFSVVPSSVVLGSQSSAIQEVAVSRVGPVEAKKALDLFARGDADVQAEFALFSECLQQGDLDEEQLSRVYEAVVFAAEKHRLQTRLNSKRTPYIIHPIGVARIVMSVGGVYNPDVLIAALLHDTLEETSTDIQEIYERFGKTVSAYVEEMAGPPGLSSGEKKTLQIVRAKQEPAEVAILRFSDKLHNLKTLMRDPSSGWDKERIDQYFQWAQVVVTNLPHVNDPLYKAVNEVIAKYWESQTK